MGDKGLLREPFSVWCSDDFLANVLENRCATVRSTAHDRSLQESYRFSDTDAIRNSMLKELL